MTAPKKRERPAVEMTPAVERNIRRLGRVCAWLYGNRWQSDLARDLDVNERTIRSWVQGRYRVDPEVWGTVDKLLVKKLSRAPAIQEMVKRQQQAAAA